MTILARPRHMSSVAAFLAAILVVPATVFAFSVTGAHGRSTFNAVKHWAADMNYGVIWEPRTNGGVVDFSAPQRYVHEDFHIAVQALVSGEVYGRRNEYCIPPSVYQAQAVIDDRLRLVYVFGRPTGKRCVFPYP
ncbi:hypothetical protein [Cupriavidus sp. SK-4]|uniref:hypothetical protein n=1 Tax=Cupriavidus sp. SK-4 TaxID=574750 RepID=UPI001F32A9B8|nr:hypothetical protein [Cupriavidus sp. SK-4]